MRNMRRGENHKCVSVSAGVEGECRPPAQLCRGWGRTFPEREPGLALAPRAHATPPLTSPGNCQSQTQLRTGLCVLGRPMEKEVAERSRGREGVERGPGPGSKKRQ